MKISQFIPVLFLAASLAACQSTFNGRGDTLTTQMRHPIAVDKRLVSETVDVPGPSGALSGDERDRAAAILTDYRDRGLGKLTIAAPFGTPNADAGLKLAGELTDLAREAGVSPKRIEIAPYRATANEANPPLLLSYTVYDATPAPCGDFSRNLAFSPLNKQTPNFGCATQNNLAAIVENPRDLVAPRDQDPADQGRRRTTLDKYRKGEATEAQKTEQNDGSVSGVK